MDAEDRETPAYPSARICHYFARFSLFTRDSYRYVAKQVAKRHVTGRFPEEGTGLGYLPIEIAKRIRAFDVTDIGV